MCAARTSQGKGGGGAKNRRPSLSLPELSRRPAVPLPRGEGQLQSSAERTSRHGAAYVLELPDLLVQVPEPSRCTAELEAIQ